MTRAKLLKLAVPALLLAAGLWRCGRGPVTAESVSPDGRWRVRVVERSGPMRLDRNFAVKLKKLPWYPEEAVFRSPDEGRPPDGRLVWAADSSRVLLVGGSFFVRPEAAVEGNDQLYLMLEPVTGRVWCNASQRPDSPGFGPEDLKDRAWAGWTPPALSTAAVSGAN